MRGWGAEVGSAGGGGAHAFAVMAESRSLSILNFDVDANVHNHLNCHVRGSHFTRNHEGRRFVLAPGGGIRLYFEGLRAAKSLKTYGLRFL